MVFYFDLVWLFIVIVKFMIRFEIGIYLFLVDILKCYFLNVDIYYWCVVIVYYILFEIKFLKN